MSKTIWTANFIPDLHGKVAIVTGANSGLGYFTTQELARKGATVVMACRNQHKAKSAMIQIHKEVQKARLNFIALDLASLKSVRNFVKEFKIAFGQLDILCNNAGIMAIPRRETADGFEMQFGTNHLGHFALTALLIDTIMKTPKSRIVNVSSLAHRFGKMNFEDLNGEKSYAKWAAYGQSKLANILFTLELQRRLTEVNSETLCIAAHPGYAATNLQGVGPQMENSKIGESMNAWANKMFAQSAEMGALPSLYAATHSPILGGNLYGPHKFWNMRGYPVLNQIAKQGRVPADGKRLWKMSEEMTKIKFPDFSETV
jgi:NAD(P)-dependent dehydrogenase (short-subunit alcohol dehydrogenase family)